MPPLKKKMSGSPVSNSGRSLFGDTGVDVSNLDGDKKTIKETERFRTQYIDLEKIRFYEFNKFHPEDTAELEDSIRYVGVLAPICLITKKDEKNHVYYEVIAGSRRFISVTNLYKKAIENNDEENVRRFSKIFSIVFPLGATQEEIDRVYMDTNVLARQITPQDMFTHLSYFLKKDEKGNYKNLPEGTINIAKELQYKFKKLGINFGMTKIKTFVSIYMAHNKQIQKDLENNFLTIQQAYTISQMPPGMQDSVMEQFKTMTDKEIKDYIKTYNLELKIQKQNNKRSVDVINSLNKISENAELLTSVDKIVIVNKEDKFVIKKTVDELISKLNTIKEKLSN